MQHESRLDPLACADEPQLFDAAHAVLASKLFGRDSSCVQNVRIGDELSRPGRVSRVEVGHRLRRRLDGGLTSPLSTRHRHDALLCGAKTDYRCSRDREREDSDQDRLTALVPHGVHSTRRAAVPSTISRGRPTNPSGTGRA